MTEEQKKLVEDNERLIWYVGRKYLSKGYNVYEEYGTLAITLCEVATKWDMNKGTFATYACASLENAIKEYFRSQTTKKRSDYTAIVSLDEPVYEDDNSVLLVKDTLGTLSLEDTLLLFEVDDILTKQELQICRLRSKGMNQTEISEKVGCSQSYVSRMLMVAKKI